MNWAACMYEVRCSDKYVGRWWCRKVLLLLLGGGGAEGGVVVGRHNYYQFEKSRCLVGSPLPVSSHTTHHHHHHLPLGPPGDVCSCCVCLTRNEVLKFIRLQFRQVLILWYRIACSGN